MRLSELLAAIEGKIISPSAENDPEITGGYSGDLMSDIIANAEAGYVWVTMQIHENVVAVAGMKDLGAVVICSGRMPEDNVIEKAAEQQVLLASSPLPAFEIAGRLYDAGIRGV